MVVRRRSWLYRLSGQRFVHSISFKQPITAAKVKEVLRRTVGAPLELWGSTRADVLDFSNRSSGRRFA